METESIDLMAIFFRVLLGFITINMLINFFLLYTRKLRIYKILAIYWPVLFVVYICQSLYTIRPLPVALAYSANLFSCSIFALIGFEVLQRKFPFKNYILYFIPFYPLTYFLYSMGYEFKIMAMPFAIATATPLIHACFYILIKDRRTTTKLQKFLGVLYFLQAIHCINFALFRMVPSTQIVGWLVAYVLFDFAAIILPSIALETANITEKVRLEYLVKNKTFELNQSLKENQRLLKVVIHDLSNPLMALKYYIHYMNASTDNMELVEKAKKSLLAMENMITEIRNLHLSKSNKNNLHSTCLKKCFDDLVLILDQSLKAKNIKLIINNHLGSDSMVMADSTLLTHSIIGNFLSNSIKFSSNNSHIIINAREENEAIVIEVVDQGQGIDEKTIQNILLENEIESQVGTAGEVGSGYGLTIAKSFIESFGDKIEFDSKPKLSHPTEHGTKVRITLKKAYSSMQES